MSIRKFISKSSLTGLIRNRSSRCYHSCLFSQESTVATIEDKNVEIPSVRVLKDVDYYLNQERFHRKYLSQAQQEKIAEQLNNSSENQQVKVPFQLKSKTPKESEVFVHLPFSTDSKLRDIYMNAFNGIRIGRILEDLDALAGEIAYKHSDGFNSSRPLTIVTAAIDRIDLQKPIIPFFDLELIGRVTFTGTSSMEIRMEVFSLHSEGKKELCMVAYFVMVALDRFTNRSTPVHSVEPITAEDKELFEMGKRHQVNRKTLSDTSLMKKPPNDEERTLIHNLFLENLKSSGNFCFDENEKTPMSKTSLKNSKIMHPTQRNIHGKIFGGFLLREAYEIAFLTAYMFTKHKPTFLSLNENSFLKPVEVGSVVDFTSMIVYTGERSLEIRVEVNVVDPPSQKKMLCNTFHFAFICPIVREVVPETYLEAMYSLEGKRIHMKGKSMAESMHSHLASSY
ncbi:hypothetical protein ABK040_011725 [Willaertia magna]